ncbi:MAG: hypothetical protein P8189_31935 [Anaerolineae bacterium]
MIKRGLTLVNALNITPHISINDDAGLWAGRTTAQVLSVALMCSV